MVNISFLEQSIINDFNNYNFILLKRDEAIDIIMHICSLITKYIFDNILEMVYDNIPVDFYNNIFEVYSIQLEDVWLHYVVENNKELTINMLNNDIYNSIIIAHNIVQKYYIPVRSYNSSFIRVSQTENKKAFLYEKINYLKSIPQPEQRTEEWYRFRHTTLTASSIWKVFYSESSQNQLIYEKCKPVIVNSNTRTNINSPFHWGQKYEPLSVLYYEYIYSTQIDDFGCIPHEKYSYIAASPDGINCKKDNERYGRMLEIKNIVNRDITGIPKMEYWIQMQIQMETCNLNECDFLETRFIEYESEDMFNQDIDFVSNITEGLNAKGNIVYRGCILHFEGEQGPIYEYHNFGMTIEQIKIWETQTINRYPECSWVQTIYWKLSEISCILVLRNKTWFLKAQPYIELIWNIIEQEKDSNYEHRAPKKRTRVVKDKLEEEQLSMGNCLLDTSSF
tara:strand:- start:168 stop:1520 length:1353 start_codon:yes stop_codon:yes gene_type:complete